MSVYLYSCLNYPACISHRFVPHYIVIGGLSGCTKLFYIISYTERFSEENY